MRYLFPYLYGFNTRAKTIFYKISFLIVIVFPIFACVISYNCDIKYVLGRFFIGFTAMYCIYEIGYIFNDTYTIKYEKNPTYRLNDEEQKKVEKLSIILISERVLIVTILVIFLSYLNAKNIMVFVICLVLLNFFYSLHNYFRSKINAITMFLIVLMKYITVPVLFINLNDYWFYVSILTILIPVLRMIEYGTKDYCKISSIKNIDLFRIFYYGFLTIASAFLYFFSKDYLIFVILATYFFVFRIICYLIIRLSNGRIRKREVNRGTKL